MNNVLQCRTLFVILHLSELLVKLPVRLMSLVGLRVPVVPLRPVWLNILLLLGDEPGFSLGPVVVAAGIFEPRKQSNQTE